MKASIIVVVYNGRRYLQGCLASVLKEMEARDEVIVVDNGSADGSAAMIRERWPEVRLIENGSNRGFAAAANQGAAVATTARAAGSGAGDIVVFLNQDTVVMPGWLAGLRRALAEDPRAALATSKIVSMGQAEAVQTCGLDAHFSGLTFERERMEEASGRQGAAEVGAASGASMAIRRGAWEALGGFDEDLWMYYEDVDLSWRAVRQGWRCVYAPESLVRHDHSVKPGMRALYYTTRNRYVLLLKNLSRSTLLILLPGLALAEAMEWGYCAAQGREALGAKAAAWGWLCRQAGSLGRPRKENRPARRGDRAILARCSPRIRPRFVTGGRAGRAVTAAVNTVLAANYGLARLFLGWWR